MLKKVQVLAQTTDLWPLGRNRCSGDGQFEADLEPLPDDAVEKARTGLVMVLDCGGQHHAGEEAAMLEACKDLPARLLLVPRHPQRFDEVAGLIESHGLAVVRLSQGDAGCRWCWGPNGAVTQLVQSGSGGVRRWY